MFFMSQFTNFTFSDHVALKTTTFNTSRMTEEDGLCCSSSAIKTKPGPSSLLEERSKTPIVFMVSLCCRLPPQTGGNGQGIVYRIGCGSLEELLKKVLHNESSISVHRQNGAILTVDYSTHTLREVIQPVNALNISQ